jgi:hypothetical protein
MPETVTVVEPPFPPPLHALAASDSPAINANLPSPVTAKKKVPKSAGNTAASHIILCEAGPISALEY